MGCAERLKLTADEYEAVRAHGDRFLVVPGHERPEDEIVIHERPGYLIVKKIGEQE
jgi:phage repressor protein C with HTH and peptisase S24 domain